MSRHTIREWEKIKGVQILDPDGFDRKDPELMTRTFNEHEFNEGMMGSTVRMRSVTTPTSTDEVKPTPVGEFNYRPGVSVRSDNQPQTELDKAWCETLFDESGNSKLIDGYKMPIELKQAILAHQEKAVREARIDENRKAYAEVSKRYRGFRTRSSYQSVKYKSEGVGIMLKTGQAQKLLDMRLAKLTSKERNDG